LMLRVGVCAACVPWLGDKTETRVQSAQTPERACCVLRAGRRYSL